MPSSVSTIRRIAVTLNCMCGSRPKLHLPSTVFERARFVERRDRPGRGFGLNAVRAIAREIRIDTNGGTRICMIFDVSTVHVAEQMSSSPG